MIGWQLWQTFSALIKARINLQERKIMRKLYVWKKCIRGWSGMVVNIRRRQQQIFFLRDQSQLSRWLSALQPNLPIYLVDFSTHVAVHSRDFWNLSLTNSRNADIFLFFNVVEFRVRWNFLILLLWIFFSQFFY